MMANPLPVVPDLQKTYQGLENVMLMQPKLSPRPTPSPEAREKKFKEETEEEVEDRICLEELNDPIYVPKPAEPVKQTATITETSPDMLKDLMVLDQMTVVRQLGVKDAMTLRGKKNQFFVRSPESELVYTILEDNNWWVGYLCYGLRPMQLRVLNSADVEVIRIIRPYSFTTRIVPCQLQRMQVFSPPGNLIGMVVQQWTPLRPHYTIIDALGSQVFQIKGPRFTVSCFQDVQFHILRPNGTEVAATNKRWEGIMHALFYAAVKDRFGMTFFEKDLKGEEKALVLAAALLLDYMYYDI